MAISSSIPPDSSVTFSYRENSYLSKKYSALTDYLPGVYKTKKIGLCVFAAISLSAGVIVGVLSLAGMVTFPLGLSIFLVGLAATGVFVLIHEKITDYDDPEVLCSLREQAKGASFDQLIKFHGLEHMVKYSIPISPLCFSEITIDKINKLSFLQAKEFYHDLRKSIQKIVPDHPFSNYISQSRFFDWHAKWREETKDLSLSVILERYPIESLQDCLEFDRREIDFLIQAKASLDEARDLYIINMQSLARSYEAEVAPFQEQLEQSLLLADESYIEKWDPDRLTQIQNAYEHDITTIDSNKKTLLLRVHAELNIINASLKERGISITRKTELLARKKAVTLDRTVALQNFELLKLSVQESFLQSRREYANDIQSADTIRSSEYEAAQACFTSNCHSINLRRDQHVDKFKNDLDEVERTSEESYRRFVSNRSLS